MNETDNTATRLEMMRKPFDPEQISKLPKPTKAQTNAVKESFQNGKRCDVCGGWHHPKVIHLDYVGHAALTDRLLDVDPLWQWEPEKRDENGFPVLDKDGGMWIKLTVCGVTRPGYGDSGGKTGSNATKERIGDALRNAAMRFGAALDLWHKGDLHGIDEPEDEKPEPIPVVKWQEGIESFFERGHTVAKLNAWLNDKKDDIALLSEEDQHKVKVCVRETMAAITENLAKPPETVKCPESGREAVKADCLQSECHKTCEAMGNSHDNKLEISIDG